LLHWLGYQLVEIYGPFRLLKSHLFLIGFGAALAAILTWYLLPKLWSRLPSDQGRQHAVGASQSVGKPVGAGIIFVPVFVLVCLLVLPLDWRFLEVLAVMLLVMLEGYLDDRTPGGWSEVQLGIFDLGIALLGAIILCQFQAVQIWLPVIKAEVLLPAWAFIPLATGLIWLTTNATNCTDGVDGLSGSLSAVAFLYLGGVLYGILGHPGISEYLLVPYYPDGNAWATLGFVMTGCLGGYLWHNAPPSLVLMGDAGSRPVGFLMGMLVLASGNPFLILVVSGVILANGATGLLKVFLLRFFKIGIFKKVRYPLHDHVRREKGWSNSQVLVRFVLLQMVLTPLLLLFLFKVR
jgi:phospho-N-acetylmuramoyl-pentapeptide-transferase